MDLIAIIKESELVGHHDHERTWRVEIGEESWILRAFREGESEQKARLPHVAGLATWRAFQPLQPEERRHLGLGEGQWLLAARPHIEGKELAEQMGRAREKWLDWGVILATCVRGLHAQGEVHGDIQPRNVIIDPEERPWLIDIPLFRRPRAGGGVAGSAALMAPELWEGEEPSAASDTYSLAALICWMSSGSYPVQADATAELASWARVHRLEIPIIDEEIPGRVAGALKRSLSKKKRSRPPVQELIDALNEGGAEVAPPYIALTPSLYRKLERNIVESCDGQKAILLEGKEGTGRSYALQRIYARLQLKGERTLLWSEATLRGPKLFSKREVLSAGDPWEPIRQLLVALGGERTPTTGAVTGDRLHVLQTWTNRLRQVLPAGQTILLWDDFDLVAPDIRAFWDHYFREMWAGEAKLVLVAATEPEDPWSEDVQRVSVSGPDLKSWTGWRARTLLAEVRDIPSGRWKELVEAHGSQPVHLFDAINREVGSERPAEFAPKRPPLRPTPDISVIFARDWRRHVDGLLRGGAYTQAVETCRQLYEVLERSGPAERLDILTIWMDGLMRTSWDPSEVSALEKALTDTVAEEICEGEAAILLARLHYELGRYSQGLAALEEIAATGSDYHRWRGQILLSSGRFEEARQTAQKGLEQLARAEISEGLIYCHLNVLVHAAQAMTGDREALEALQSLGSALTHKEVTPQLRARAHAYRAIGLSRCDELDGAADAYLRALEEVESAGLLGQMPTYLLNVGTAYHRQGRLGLAREYYARGSRLSQDTTRASTRALLMANEANIDITLGRLEEARPLVERALAVAKAKDLGVIRVMCLSLAGDIELAAGGVEEALEVYELAIGDENASDRQVASLMLYSAEASLRLGRAGEALVQLDNARRLIEENRLADLEHHHGILRARHQWTDGGTLGTMAGIELFRRHLLKASEAGNHRLVLQQSPFLWEQLQDEDLSGLVGEVVEVVKGSKNAVAMGLTRKLREDFFAHLPVLGGGPGGEEEKEKSREPEDQDLVERFYRMLSLNEMILQIEDLDKLWIRALDIALSLSGAERGYLLIKDTSRSRVGDYRIRASRDIDGDVIPRPHLKVSRTIAEEAARTGQAVITVNARQDGRFDSALSVVDLDLMSVLCVPVRDASGLLGALYLDHRFQSGVFEGEVPKMMEAFAHQLALAITNGRRMNELRREKGRLKAANEKLDAVLAEREAALAGLQERYSELTDEVDRTRLGATGMKDKFPKISFISSKMEDLLSSVDRVATVDIPVVITGESGVGKELVAGALHERSPRRNSPLVTCNCAAISESLFESEMFGHVRGAFTGANTDRMGLFQAAQGGTLFLDEVGEMPVSMQVKLLRALQEGRVRPVGASKDEAVDVRVVAATNRDLAAMVDEGSFREDLYYRLAAMVLEVPPLRERREDIPLIARHLLEEISGSEEGVRAKLSPEAAHLLMIYEWPGNVRELENALRTAILFAEAGEISEKALMSVLPPIQGTSLRKKKQKGRGRKAKATREAVVEALRRFDDDHEKTAEFLEVSERTLYRYLNRYGIE